MGTCGVVGQSRRLREPGSLLCFNRLSDGPPSADAASHTPERSTTHGGTRGTPSSVGAVQIWLEERKGSHQDHLFGERAKRLLVPIWILPLRRNLGTK